MRPIEPHLLPLIPSEVCETVIINFILQMKEQAKQLLNVTELHGGRAGAKPRSFASQFIDWFYLKNENFLTSFFLFDSQLTF